MPWLFMLFGLVVGGIAGESLTGAILGAAVGLSIGQSRVLQQLRRQNTELNEALKAFETRFERGTTAVVERLQQLEKNAVAAPPIPTDAPPESATTPIEIDQTAPLQTDTSPVDPLHAAASQSAPSSLTPTPDPTQAMGNNAPEAVLQSEDVDAHVEPMTAMAAANEIPPAHDVTPAAPSERQTTRATVPPSERQAAARARKRPSRPSQPSLIGKALVAARTWLLGGNVVLRMGALLLFLGLAFLLRYATKDVVVPIELRYAGVAFAGLVMIALGWKLRARNTSYALVMQGLGIGVMYLTVFAAFRLHPLLPSGFATVLLLMLTASLIALAILQNAVGLASAAIMGAFAAPILTSTGSGNHVALFSYFALLNTAIMVIAWYKAWRILNLIGFVGTFGIGFAWGLRSYTPELLGSTEPFLVLFFLMYVGIGLLFSRRKLLEMRELSASVETSDVLRWSARQADYVDASLLFGPPLIGFGLQYAVISHLEFGAAFSALFMGIFYLGIAQFVKQRAHESVQLLVEICLALGVVFGTLAIPLALDANWTATAWAVEGAGLYWIGHRQQRSLARLFALFLQLCAAFNYAGTLMPGDESMVSGAPLGSALLGVALLFSHYHLHRSTFLARSADGDNAQDYGPSRWEQRFLPVLACLGLAFLYLLVPLFFYAQGTALLWALAGLISLYFALRLPSKSFLFCGFAVQLLGGALFLTHMEMDGGAQGVFASGWKGLLAASWVGVALIAGMIMTARHPFARADTRILKGLSWVLIVGLIFINLAVLFVLSWDNASAVWGVSGLIIIWLALLRAQRSAFYFGCLLEVMSGLTFFFAGGVFDQGFDVQARLLDLSPLAHMGFWTPAVLAAAAFISAWRLHVVSRSLDVTQDNAAWMRPKPIAQLSTLMLLWSAGWWGFTAFAEIARFVAPDARAHIAVLVIAVTLGGWGWVARRAEWRTLAHLCVSLMPFALVTLTLLAGDTYHPLAEWGWLAWAVTLAAHVWHLKQLPDLLRPRWLSAAHIAGCWCVVALPSLELQYVFYQLAEPDSAWRWLGWVLVPAFFLLLMVSPRHLGWPINAFEKEYRTYATLPVAIVLFAWFWLANGNSDGDASPLPFLPLINPLELAMLFALFGVMQWSRKVLPVLMLGVPPASQSDHLQSGPLRSSVPIILMGVSLFALLTASVFRTAYHWADVPFNLDAQLSSMLVQASLSILWTLLALGLMIVGHKKGLRQLWLAGGVLIVIVVAKLFFIELGNRGGLERVISFMGVGVLLLVVGYFAPLPPRRPEPDKTSDSQVSE